MLSGAKMQWGGSVCFLVLKASIASSPLGSTGHLSITEWEEGNRQRCRNHRSSGAKGEGEGDVGNKGSEGRRRRNQVQRREMQKERERMRETQLVVLSSGYPPSPCLCFLRPFMAPWLRDPRVHCHFSARRCHSPRRLTCSPHGRFGVVSGPWISHHWGHRRSSDGLNVTVELLTFGPERSWQPWSVRAHMATSYIT